MLVFDCKQHFWFTRVEILSKYYENIHVICVLYLFIPLNLQYLTLRILVFDCFETKLLNAKLRVATRTQTP